jgi:phosphohistidine phosphatase
MELYILRHGIAVDHGAPGFDNDADRPLTLKGRRKMEQIAEAMLALDLSFDLILSSPYPRARQTAEIVAGAFQEHKKLEFTDTLTPDGSHKQLVELIKHLEPEPGSVLVCGHEPYLSGLISLLLSGDTELSVTLKKGGLCKLSIASLQPGRCATLEWLLTPKQMALMA